MKLPKEEDQYEAVSFRDLTALLVRQLRILSRAGADDEYIQRFGEMALNNAYDRFIDLQRVENLNNL